MLRELDIYMQRLDVICEITKFALQPGQRASKTDLRMLYDAAQKVVDAYEKDKKDANADS